MFGTTPTWVASLERAMSDPTIRVEGLGRSFGSIRALDDVNVTLDGPAIVGIAGPNGAGKKR